jgi:hypothetical protein
LAVGGAEQRELPFGFVQLGLRDLQLLSELGVVCCDLGAARGVVARVEL